MFLNILFFILVILHPTFSGCPQGAIQGISPGDCYKVFSAPTNWVSAEENCVQNGGHLASISSTFQNAFIQTETETLFYNVDIVWIGGNALFHPGNWTWSDNTPFSYTNWGKGQPTGNQGLCTTINWANGKWFSQDCVSLSFPYVCKINGSQDSSISTCPTSASLTCPSCPTSDSLTSPSCPTSDSLTDPSDSPSTTTTTPICKPCPAGYLYNLQTEFCYKDYNLNLNFTDAEAICNKDGGHLASIHSDAESSFIGTQFGMISVCTNARCAQNWIGLQFQNGQWTWTDGTPTDYLNWRPGDPSGIGNCTFMYLSQLTGNYLYFINYPCASLYMYNFICKCSAL